MFFFCLFSLFFFFFLYVRRRVWQWNGKSIDVGESITRGLWIFAEKYTRDVQHTEIEYSLIMIDG